ncbi:equilibrative nucleotide transporter 1 [Nymphaea colorata]|nr:equilibrative nucleotide transporter 1 [Nymphaea colorata]
MGFSDNSNINSAYAYHPGAVDGDAETERLPLNRVTSRVPEDSFHLAYISYFVLGAGFLLPWNAFITAVDYFTYLYPEVSIDRVFAVTYMLVCLAFLLLIIAFFTQRSTASFRINAGLLFFLVSLLVIPLMDAFYLKGRSGLYDGYYVTVAAIALSGVGDALVQGSLIGSAGELPPRYMQALVAGTAASAVLVSAMRIITKAVYPQDARGLRKSANLYFGLSIAMMFICLVCFNLVDRLPVIQYYKDLKLQAVQSEEDEEKNEKDTHCMSSWGSNLYYIVGRVKWYGIGILLIYVVTLSIFPGYITEDVHSELLKDWYSILLIAAYNVFDLVGKSLTAVYVIQNARIAVGASVARLLFYPLFLACLHGPKFFRTEIPVTLLTCLLGLTNGYFTSVLMILAPKVVHIQQAEAAGIVLVLFLVIGLAVGSVVAWFWVI